jgi:hypothetical protein
MVLLYKQITVGKFKGVKTRYNLTESSEEGYGSRRTALPTMRIMIMMMLLQKKTRKK